MLFEGKGYDFAIIVACAIVNNAVLLHIQYVSHAVFSHCVLVDVVKSLTTHL